MLTYFTNRTQNDYINIPLQKKYEHVQFKKKKTLSDIILYLRHTFYLASYHMLARSHKNPQGCIFSNLNLFLWTYGLTWFWTQTVLYALVMKAMCPWSMLYM